MKTAREIAHAAMNEDNDALGAAESCQIGCHEWFCDDVHRPVKDGMIEALTTVLGWLKEGISTEGVSRLILAKIDDVKAERG